jgi:hypothetical protein
MRAVLPSLPHSLFMAWCLGTGGTLLCFLWFDAPCVTHECGHEASGPTGCVPSLSKQPFRRWGMKNDTVLCRTGGGNFKTTNLRGMFEMLPFKQNFPNLIHSFLAHKTVKWGRRTGVVIKRRFQPDWLRTVAINSLHIAVLYQPIMGLGVYTYIHIYM